MFLFAKLLSFWIIVNNSLLQFDKFVGQKNPIDFTPVLVFPPKIDFWSLVELFLNPFPLHNKVKQILRKVLSPFVGLFTFHIGIVRYHSLGQIPLYARQVDPNLLEYW